MIGDSRSSETSLKLVSYFSKSCIQQGMQPGVVHYSSSCRRIDLEKLPSHYETYLLGHINDVICFAEDVQTGCSLDILTGTVK